MADKKITELTNITGANLVDADEFVVVDISADETKAITLGELKEAFDSGSGFVRITGDTMTGDLTVPNVIVSGNVDGRDISVDGTKLDTIETNADVTDAANVTSAGALMTTGGTMTGDVGHGDGVKATFGASADLQVFHDGSNSTIADFGTGVFNIASDGAAIQLSTNTGELMAYFAKDGAAQLFYDNSKKLETTATGVDITGTLTSDGLTVETASAPKITVSENTGTGTASIDFVATAAFPKTKIVTDIAAGDLYLETLGNDRLKIANNGDISFYEDTGTTPKFFWDASAESLGIGTASPTQNLHIKGTTNVGVRIEANSNSASLINFADPSDANVGQILYDHTSNYMRFNTNDTEAMRIDSGGHLMVGGASNGGLGSFTLGDTSDARQDVNILTSTTGFGTINFADGTSGADRYRGYISYRHDGNYMQFATDASERMRIDSSGNVGIGTSNPYGDLHLQGAQQDVILTNSDADGVAGATIGRFISQARGYGNNGAEMASIDFETNASAWYKGDIVFKTNNSDGTDISIDAAERMRIDSSGNVGIGTSSPSSNLHVDGNSAAIRVNESGGGDLRLSVTGSTTRVNGYSNHPMLFSTNNSERMRIDSSGNLLVGKTVVNNDDNGLLVQPNGNSWFTATGNYPLGINRKTSDGALITFTKDQSTVGSIASVLNGSDRNLDIGSGDTRLLFYGPTSPAYVPRKANNSASDGYADLGLSSNRFKDLYLSGGVYLGGTGSANKLDDYEEGTWTPILTGSGGNPTQSYNDQVGYYTKVGNMVHLTGWIYFSGSGISAGSGALKLGGLPFTITSALNARGALSIAEQQSFSTAGNGAPTTGFLVFGTTTVDLQVYKNDAGKVSGTTAALASDVQNLTRMAFTCTYTTSA